MRDRGNYALQLIARDDGGPRGAAGVQTSEFIFVLTVDAFNEPPILAAIGDKVAVVGEPLDFSSTSTTPTRTT